MSAAAPTTAYPRTAYKVLTGEQMARLLAEGLFTGAPVDLADGYIHLSAADQVTATVDKHFADQSDLSIAAVGLAALEALHPGAIRWEVSRSGALFPHLYAALPLSAVTAHAPLTRASDGSVILPA